MSQKFEFITGINPIIELLRAERRRCYELYIMRDKGEVRVVELLEIAKSKGIKVNQVSREEIFKLSGIEKNQGVAAKVDLFQYLDLFDLVPESFDKGENPVFLMLDGILDPQNLGALLRTAHLTGISCVILPEDNSAPVGPAAQRASAGAVEYLNIAKVVNLKRTITTLKAKGFWVVGADVGDETIYSYDFTREPHLIVLGSEGRGMRRLVREACDKLLSIPMVGKIGSYNVSVAGGIFMSEVMRQRLSVYGKT